MRLFPLSPNLFACLLLILLSITACGGSNNSSTTDPNDPPAVENSSDDSDTDPSIIKVSDVRTLATPSEPVIVFNDAGDGISVWSVSSAGDWLYYALYDRLSASWSEPQQLVALELDDQGSGVQVVASEQGFAVAWHDQENNLFTGLLRNSEWHISQISPQDDPVDLYRLVSNGSGYLITWVTYSAHEVYASVSRDGVTWDESSLLHQGARLVDLESAISNGSGYLVTFYDWGLLLTAGRIYDGSTWQDTEQLIDTFDVTTVASLLASNGQGYSLIWKGSTEQSTTVWNRVYNQATGWGEPKIVTSYDHQENDQVDVWQLVSNGTGYCVTIQTNYSEIDALIDPLGNAGWGSSTQIFSTTAENRMILKHTLVSDGEGYAVFLSEDESVVSSPWQSTLHHYGRVYRNGSWRVDDSSSFPVVVYHTDFSDYLDRSIPIEAAGFNGEYAVALVQQNSGSDSVVTYGYDSSSGWMEMELLGHDRQDVAGPVVVASPTQGLSVVWNQVSDSGVGLSTYSNRLHEGQWRGKQLMYEANYRFGSSYEPKLVSGVNGETLAVWSQDRNGYRALMANIEVNGQWLEPVVLADKTTQTPPVVTQNESGYVVVWEEQVHDWSYNLKALAFGADQWDESIIETSTLIHSSSNRIYPALASNGSDFLLVYMDVAPDMSSKNFLSRLFDGVVWHDPQMIAEDVYNNRKYPQIATNGSTYRAVWMQGVSDDMNIYSAEFDGMTWGQQQLVSPMIEKDTDPWNYNWAIPVVASNGEGYAIIWFDGTKVKGSLYTNRWSEAELLGNVNEHYYYDEGPIVASNGRGYAVAWYTNTEPGAEASYALYANVYDAVSWSGVVNLSASVGTDVFILDFNEASEMISVSGDRYAIIWGTGNNDLSGENTESIYARIFDGSDWSASTQLNRNRAEIRDYQLAGDGAGFLAAWLQLSGEGQFKLLTKRFDDSGWAVRDIVGESEYDKYDLSLRGDEEGYQAIWTGAEGDGDPWVRVPWSMSGL